MARVVNSFQMLHFNDALGSLSEENISLTENSEGVTLLSMENKSSSQF